METKFLLGVGVTFALSKPGDDLNESKLRKVGHRKLLPILEKEVAREWVERGRPPTACIVIPSTSEAVRRSSSLKRL